MTKPNKCLTSTETYMWQPGKIATHIPPVIEIEETISKLSTIVKDLSASVSISAEIQQLNKQIANWNTVLSNYRMTASTSLTGSAFDAEKLLVKALLTTYNNFVYRTQTGVDLIVFLIENLIGPAFIIPGVKKLADIPYQESLSFHQAPILDGVQTVTSSVGYPL